MSGPVAPHEAASGLLEAMCAAGMRPRDPGAVHADLMRGELVRFPCEGDSGPNGWARLFCDGRPAGAFGSWKLGIKGNWCAGSAVKAGRPDVAAIAARKAQEREARDARHRKAETQAKWLWQASLPARADHPYLAGKRMAPTLAGLDPNAPQIVVRVMGDDLLIPMHVAEDRLVNIQRIAPDGQKRFLTGGQLEGAFWYAGRLKEAPIIAIGEGFATMAAVRLSTGLPVIAAMSAANLEAVALATHARWPIARLILCADMDTGQRGNIGLEKANAAAAAVPGALVALPPRPAASLSEGKGWDFADTFKGPAGADLIRRALGLRGTSHG
jgi:putative DNA primase/helicase